MLAAAGTGTRQNRKLGGRSQIVDGKMGGLGSGKKEAEMLVGGQIQEIRLTYGGKYQGPPRNLGQ